MTDDLQNHIMLNAPKKGEVDVPLGSSITVHFDKDVKTVNINRLFEVSDAFSPFLFHSLSLNLTRFLVSLSFSPPPFPFPFPPSSSLISLVGSL